MTTFDLESARSTLREREHRVLPGDRRAAVAAVLRQRGDGPEILLIKRAEHPDDPWSGHMAFPGGREEDQDADLVATAVRETREEIGLDLGYGQLLGPLDDIEAVARGRRVGLVIRPLVFEVTKEVPFRLNYEVEEALWAPVGPMLRGEAKATCTWEVEGRTHRFPAYDVDGRIVWGLTYRMLNLLFETVRSGR